MAPPRPSSRVLRSRSESVLDALTRRPCERHRVDQSAGAARRPHPPHPPFNVRCLARTPASTLEVALLVSSVNACRRGRVRHRSRSSCRSTVLSRASASSLARLGSRLASLGRTPPCPDESELSQVAGVVYRAHLDRVPLARPATSSRSARSRRRTVPFGPAPRSAPPRTAQVLPPAPPWARRRCSERLLRRLVARLCDAP
jgi:hypothetical protein